MYRLILLFVLSFPLYSQHTLPPFGSKPDDVWKYLKIDTLFIRDTMAAGDLVNFALLYPKNADSLDNALFTFHKDSLISATFYYTYRGDLPKAVDHFEKRNKGYEFAHGSRQRFIKYENENFWFDFTLPQVASFLNIGYFYQSTYYMPKDYQVVTWLLYFKEADLTRYDVKFISRKAVELGLLD